MRSLTWMTSLVFVALFAATGCDSDDDDRDASEVDGVDATDSEANDARGDGLIVDATPGVDGIESEGDTFGSDAAFDGLQGDGEGDTFNGDVFGGDTIAPDTLEDGFDSFDGTAGDIGNDTPRDGDINDVERDGDDPDGFDATFDNDGIDIGVDDAFLDATPSDGNLEETGGDRDTLINNDALEVGPQFDTNAFDSQIPDDTATPFDTTSPPPDTFGPEPIDF